jgi:hypothetical protein
VKTSAGTIPEGLMLYQFQYPDKLDFIGRPTEVFFFCDVDAREFAHQEGATKVVHVISGREIKC